MKKVNKRLVTPFLVAATMLVATSASATTTDDVIVQIEGGNLELTASNVVDFGVIKLEKQPKEVTTGFDNVFNVVDATGTQEGWRLTVSATPFTISTPAGGWQGGTGAYSLPTGSIAIKPFKDIRRVGVGSSIAPTSAIASKTVIDDGTGVTIVRAGVGEGMGEFELEFDTDALSLVVDATTAKVDNVNYPGGITPYESTISWDLISAP